MTYDDEMLMAYADGELDADQRAGIAAALATDPELARRVEAHQSLRAQISGHYEAGLDAPVSEALMALLTTSPDSKPVEDSKVVRLPSRAARETRPAWTNWAALAASLVIGVMIGSQWTGRDGVAPLLRTTPDGLVADGWLEAALSGDVSGSTNPEGVSLIFTFPDSEGHYCRGFTASEMAGIACRDGEVWRVRSTGTLPAPSGGEIRTASSGLPASVLAEVDRLSAGDPLDAAGEAELIARQWRPAN